MMNEWKEKKSVIVHLIGMLSEFIVNVPKIIWTLSYRLDERILQRRTREACFLRLMKCEVYCEGIY